MSESKTTKNTIDLDSLPKELVIRMANDDDSDGIDLLALWCVIWKWKYFIIGFTFLATMTAAIVTVFFMPDMYKATAVIEPTEKAKSSLLANLGALADFTPGQVTDKTQAIINFLGSRKLKEWIIVKYGLLQRYNPDLWDPEKKTWITDDPQKIPTLVKALQGNILKKIFSANSDIKTGLIDISFIDESPVFAAQVVSGITGELSRYLEKDHVTDAKRHRIFVEKQLKTAQINLEFWEDQRPGEKFDTSEILRETQCSRNIYIELRKQLALAKIDEDKEVVGFKTLDEPMVPQIKSSPKRFLIIFFCFLSSPFLVIIFIFFIEFFLKNIVKSVKPKSKNF